MNRMRTRQMTGISVGLLQTTSRPAEDIVHAGCLKTTCPGLRQFATCQFMRSAQQCGGQSAPRTSFSHWWLR